MASIGTSVEIVRQDGSLSQLITFTGDGVSRQPSHRGPRLRPDPGLSHRG